MSRTQQPLTTLSSGDYLLIDVLGCNEAVTVQYKVTTSSSVTLKIEGSIDGVEFCPLQDADLVITTNKSGLVVVSDTPLAKMKVSYTGTGTVKVGYLGV